VWNPVVKEPVVSDGSGGIFEPLVADLCVRGVWQTHTKALFDIRVVDIDARSYCGCTPTAVLCSAEVEKKHKYSLACQSRCVHHYVCLWMVCLHLKQGFCATIK